MQRTFEGCTAPQKAPQEGHEDIARSMLLQNGADVNTYDKWGCMTSQSLASH